MLHGTYLEQNRQWPRGLFDFDRIFPLTNLRLRSDDAHQTVFASSTKQNWLALLFVLILGAMFWGLWSYRAELGDSMAKEPWIVRALCWTALTIAVIGWVLCMLMALMHSKLVLDHDQGELQVFAFGRRSHRLKFTDIRLLSFENVRRMSSSDDDTDNPPAPTRVLVMELVDGTLVRLSAGAGEADALVIRHLTEACERADRQGPEPAPDVNWDESGPSPEDRETFIRANLAAICVTQFPEDEEVEWHLERCVHRGRLTYVEVRSEPSVGYEKLELIFDAIDLHDPVGMYCWEDGAWHMLSGVDPGKRHARLTGV